VEIAALGTNACEPEIQWRGEAVNNAEDNEENRRCSQTKETATSRSHLGDGSLNGRRSKVKTTLRTKFGVVLVLSSAMSAGVHRRRGHL
jgi:hypothetical protein